MKKTGNKRLALWIVLAVLAVIVIAAAIYLGDYYHAAFDKEKVFDNYKETLSDGTIVFMPEAPSAGLILYPGGKVEYTAYEPLCEACARRGIACFLVKMPFNLAVLRMNAADGIADKYPEIKSWYIGGHSLGGAMAASWADSHLEGLKGLVLLGAYSTADISDSGLAVLSVYGSEDGVMNREKYAGYLKNLPSGFTERIIEGGCHAYFGVYGSQKGDGEPKITNEQQIEITADYIAELIKDAG